MLPHAVSTLPIHSYGEDIIAALRDHQVVIVAGETGSGKSTVLPLLCREAGFGRLGRIAVTQPRRIAAVTLADYVASLDGTPVGATIGFKIRYRQRLEKSAPVVYMTDGVLQASLAGDPLLERYDAIIVDEAHERSMNIDFLLGYLRMLLPRRPELRCIIASATLDTKLFSRAFNHAPVITVTGRKFTVEIRYRPVVELWKGYSIDSFIEGAVVAAERICAESKRGDILIFFPTVDDVAETIPRLRARIRESGIRFLPLHGRLAPHCQQEVFQQHPGRKIVVATNIAETSLTVPGIRFVIDTGLVRILRYEPSASLSRMPVEKVSQASAEQRSGRCGRVGDGVCIRLYSEQDYLSRPRFTLPEIKRTNLAGAILRIHALEAGDPGRFPFLQRPSAAALTEGYCQLQELGALDRKRRITRFGRTMARFPLDPPVACMLLRADEFGAVPEVMAITAALSVQEPLAAPEGGETSLIREFRHPTSDFMTYLNVWKRLLEERSGAKRSMYTSLRSFAKKYHLQQVRLREWLDAHDHLRRICREIPGFDRHRANNRASYEAIHKSLLAGLSGGIAYRKDIGMYEGIAASEIRIASVSVTARKEHPWLLFHEIVETDHVYGARAAVIDPKWVEELFGKRCRYHYEDPWYDPVSGTVRIREEVTYRSLSLIRNRMINCHIVDRPLAREVFAREALVAGEVGDRYRFIRRNREVRNIVATAERKLRRRLYAGDHALEAFYEERAPIATRRELDQLLRQRGSDSSLIAPVDELLIEPLPYDIGEYADEIIVAQYRLPVAWEHASGSPSDGATVTIPQELADALPQYWWEWQLPVFRKARSDLLVSRITSDLLAKAIDPADVVDRIAEQLTTPTGPWMAKVRQFLIDEFGISADDATFDPASYPPHLWLRVHAVDGRGVITAAFRPPLSFRRRAAVRSQPVTALHSLAEGLVRNPPFSWNEVPLLQPVPRASTGQKVPCVLFPALYKKENGVAVGVFATRNEAQTAHAAAITRLLEERLAEQLTWEIEAMKIPAATVRRAQQCGFTASLHDLIVRLLIRTALKLPDDLPPTASAFEELAKKTAHAIRGCTAAIISVLDRTFEEFEHCSRYLEKRKSRHRADYFKPLLSELDDTLNRYRRALTTDSYPVDHVMRLPEFLDAFPLRGDAAMLDPAKYRSAMREVRESQQLIDETADVRDYLIEIQRGRLLAAVEQYCIDLFAGAPKRGRGAVTAITVEQERTALRNAVQEYYRE